MPPLLRRRSVVLALCAAVLCVLSSTPATAQSPLFQMASLDAQSYGRFGAAVAPMGDVNKDGMPDLFVGAPTENVTGEKHVGRGHLYSGRDGRPLQSVDTEDPQKRADFATTAAPLQDINEDDAADVAVGAPRESLGRRDPQAGRVYFFSGTTGEVLEDIDSPNDSPNGRFGFSLDRTQDVDSDGFRDLVVGAPSEVVSQEPTTTGRIYILSGEDGDDLLEIEPPTPGTRLFGYSVAGLGDINGDGTPEVLAGAVGASPEGKHWAGAVYVFDGSSKRLLISLTSPNASADGHFGSTVAVVGDTNGDSMPDFLVGAPGESTPTGESTGRAYLFSGANGERLHTFHSPTEQSSGRFGSALTGVGDLDGDGAADVLVGAPGEASSAGRVHAFSGLDGSTLHTLASPKDQLNGSFGSALSPAGDLNGDGQVDVLIGATGETAPDGTKQSGIAYVFSGASLAPAPAASN